MMPRDWLELSPEAARSMVIEPWHPEVGQRVCVVSNMECQHRYQYAGVRDATDPSYAAGVPHRWETEHGKLGTILEAPQWAGKHNGHFYLVSFDQPLPLGLNMIGGQMYAASELEEVERDPSTGLWLPKR